MSARTPAAPSRSSRGWALARAGAIAVFALAQLYLGADDTPVADEARHVRDGAVMWRDGRIGVNPEHPPLIKLLCAAAIAAADRASALNAAAGEPMAADARFASRLRLTGARLLRVRLPVIALGILGVLAFSGLFARASLEAPVLAAIWIAFSPPWLAHAHYVTTDAAPVAFFLLAAWAVERRPTLGGAAAAGLFCGAALASKFAAPLILPFVLAWILVRSRWRGAAVAFAVALVVLLGVEAFAARHTSASDLDALSRRAFLEGGLGGPAPPAPGLDRICRRIASGSRPAAAYAIGLLDVWHRSASEGPPDYFAGRLVTGAQPLYPPETLAVKSDLPLLLAAAIGLLLLLARPRALRAGGWIALAGGLFYLAAACRSSLHLGVRHLLPLVALMAGLAMAAAVRGAGSGAAAARGAGSGVAAARSERSRNARWKIAAWILAGAHAAVAAAAFPHFVSYRNALASLLVNPRSAYDEGEDWGQDLGRLLRVEKRPLVYLTLTQYQNPEWRALVPGLRADGGDGDSYPYLVDAILLDLLEASRRPDASEPARRSFAGLAPLFGRLEEALHGGELRQSAEPTLLLIERRAAP